MLLQIQIAAPNQSRGPIFLSSWMNRNILILIRYYTKHTKKIRKNTHKTEKKIQKSKKKDAYIWQNSLIRNTLKIQINTKKCANTLY